MKTIPANDISNLSIGNKEEIERLPQSEQSRQKGIGCDELLEPFAPFLKAPCEDVISGRNNTFIVFGRDRSGPRFVTGSLYDNGPLLGPYGPKGFTKCGSIDIVAGRFSKDPKDFVQIGNTRKPISVDPDFFEDAARFYIAQKTDIDSNFRIGSPQKRESEGKSAIGLKADAVRVIAREGIKLVTGTDNKNSLGGNIFKTHGIDLIAGNDDTDLQPLTKGDNLIEFLNKMVTHINKLSGILDSFLSEQMRLNNAISNHTHISPFYGLRTTPSESLLVQGRIGNLNLQSKTKIGLYKHRINMTNLTNTYLQPFGKKYINSRWNRTN